MKQVQIISLVILSLILLINPVSSRIGFGMTNEFSELSMTSEMDQACITYYIYNPGDIAIEGYLEIDREGGGTLNKILGVDALYETLESYEQQQTSLENDYDEAVANGESTYDVEVKQDEVSQKITEINKKVISKTKTESIVIPALTKSKDESGNYQIPITFCFERPTEKYLFFFDVQDNDYCGEYSGEISGKYNPLPDKANGGTGSAILGSRSAQLKLTVKCDVRERSGILLKVIIPIIFIVIIAILLARWKKKKPKQESDTTEQTPSS